MFCQCKRLVGAFISRKNRMCRRVFYQNTRFLPSQACHLFLLFFQCGSCGKRYQMWHNVYNVHCTGALIWQKLAPKIIYCCNFLLPATWNNKHLSGDGNQRRIINDN
ncbi:unnamed protein product, partial [Ixodes persulcatus]